MSDVIDARGLSCPQPVVLTQGAIKKGIAGFKVLVDSEVSRENVIRCAENNGFTATVSEENETFTISVSK